MTPSPNNIDQTAVTEDAMIEPRRRGVPTIEVDNELMEDIRGLVREKASPFLLNILADLHAADIAEIISRLDEQDRSYLFDLLDTATGGAVLPDLGAEVREQLLKPLSSQKITEYVDQLPSDDAA